MPLVGLAFVLQLTAGPPGGGEWSGWAVAETLCWSFGLLVAFAAFAGGVASRRRSDSVKESALAAVGAGLITGFLSFGLSAVAVPIAGYEIAEARGRDVTTVYPFGPETPIGLLELRQYVIANPPDEFARDMERPLELPPNWLLFLLLQPVAFAVFAVINTGLGLVVGTATTGLSPPARRHTRWALGLGGGIAFFVVMAKGASWVRADPANSAVLGAWLPLGLPLLELLFFVWILRQREDDGELGLLAAE